MNTQDFIKKASLVHDFKYYYNNTIYIKSKLKLNITCPIHGDFIQLANAHLNGQGCPICGKYQYSKVINKKNFLELTLEKANKIHNNKFNYELISLTSYNKMSDKYPIICPIHGIFYQTLDSHVSRKRGCHKCSVLNRKINGIGVGWTFTNWKEKCKNKTPKLYVVRFNDSNESFIKIGITTQQTIQQRFSNKKGYVISILSVTTGSPKYIWDLEHKLLKILKPHKYIPLKEFEGRHECVIDDVDLVINTLNNTN